MLAILLLGLLNLAVGGPISEDVADALVVKRTGQHYGSYDWEFELYREDNCGQNNNGSVVYHGYGSKGCAAEGGPLGFYSVKVSRIAPGCEVIFYDQPTCIQNTAGVPDSKVPQLDEHTPIDACLDRGLATRGFEIKCPAPALEKRVTPATPFNPPQTARTYRWDFDSHWPVSCAVDDVDPVYHQQGDESTGCTTFAGLGVNAFKLNRIEDGCVIVLSDDVSCGPNRGGPDPKLDFIDQHTKPATCLARQNPALAFTVKCNDNKKREPDQLPGQQGPTPPASETSDWTVELFSANDCTEPSGASQVFSGKGTSTCSSNAKTTTLGFSSVKVHNLTPGCYVDFFTDATCPSGPALSSIGTRPDPPINVCVPQSSPGKAFQVHCGGTPTSPPTKRSKVPLPGYVGPPPTPMVDAPDKYAFDLFEDQSCIPSTISSPGHFQQHFNGPGDTIECQQNGATGNGFRGISIQKLDSSCQVTFFSDNECTQSVNHFQNSDPMNSCRQFADHPGADLQSVRSFIVRNCPFP
ncbi:MAG: hypothetical protein M1835_007232 [Candelina submexicana]|nr:MAG: hypothetical protein M1835_007232 [Candelina submexicana]